MESLGEPDRRYNRDPLSEYYEQLADFISETLLTNPESRRVLQQEYERIISLQRLLSQAPPEYLRQHPEVAIELVQELERTILPPVILPPPGRIIAVGEHMTVTTGQTAGLIWPNEAADSLLLSDGSKIERTTQLGKIDIASNFDTLATNANLITFTRHLMKSTLSSLHQLASLYENRSRSIDYIPVLGGVSHLARVGGKFGFSTFDITNPHHRQRATKVSKGVAAFVAGDNQTWKALSQNYKEAKVAFISARSLVKNYGSRPKR